MYLMSINQNNNNYLHICIILLNIGISIKFNRTVNSTFIPSQKIKIIIFFLLISQSGWKKSINIKSFIEIFLLSDIDSSQINWNTFHIIYCNYISKIWAGLCDSSTNLIYLMYSSLYGIFFMSWASFFKKINNLTKSKTIFSFLCPVFLKPIPLFSLGHGHSSAIYKYIKKYVIFEFLHIC